MNIALGSDHRGCKIAEKLMRDLFCCKHYMQEDQADSFDFEQFGDMSGAFLITDATLDDSTQVHSPKIQTLVYSKLAQVQEASKEFQPDPASATRCVDYPDVAAAVAEAVSKGIADRGVLICGTGVGMCITANKFMGARAAVCANEVAAELSRRHNDANILCLSGEFLSPDVLESVARTWFSFDFDGLRPEGARHKRRLEKLQEIEKKTGL